MPRSFRWTCALLVSLSAAGSATAHACDVQSAAPRLEHLRSRIASSASWTRTWRWTWSGIWGGATLLQLGWIPATTDSGVVVDSAWGAGFSALTVGSLWVLPLPVLEEDARLKSLGTPSGEGVCQALEQAEAALVRSAKAQADSVGPGAHLLNLGVNAAYTLILGLGYDRWESGLWGGGVGLVLGEAMIVSQPRALVDELEASLPKVSSQLTLVPWSRGRGQGLALMGRF